MTKETHRGFIESRYIPVGKLTVVWPQAQRGLKDHKVKKIMDNFDPAMFGTIAVAKANGSGVHHVIDGNHRRAAVQQMWGDKEQVPCQVYECDTPARAAEIFDHINTDRTAPSAVEIFRTRVTAKSDLEVQINRIVTGCGYHVGNTGAAKNISCVGALKLVYSSYGGDVLRDTLNLITAIWGGEDRQATDGGMVRGVGDLLAEYRDIDFKRMREVVAAKYTPSRLYGAAKSYRELHGGSMANAIKALFANTYNHGRNVAKHLKRVSRNGGE